MGGKGLASVAQLARHHPTKQKVMGLIPSQGMCLNCRFLPRSGHIAEATN